MPDTESGAGDGVARHQATAAARILIGSPAPYPLLAIGRLRGELRTREELQVIQAAYLIQWIEGGERNRQSGLRLLVRGERVTPAVLDALQDRAQQAMADTGQRVLAVVDLGGPNAAGIAKHLQDGFIPFYEK